ncbi:MAG: radical SAM family heme chaperone HemW [Actinomycetaceae bacterium]|nr:radical SAM family heme chaperone HemW [Actinomycetaceae bacterium]
MPAQPDGQQWSEDGHLDPVEVGPTHRHLSMYVHVPFCTVRCGYCDFNTYTADFGQGANRASYHHSVGKEIELAANVLANFPTRALHSVFFGGGTPTLLGCAQLGSILSELRRHFALEDDCEVTVEANPDTVDEDALKQLREAGFTRVSFGMQSADRQVLARLDRTHDPERIDYVVQAAKKAGLDTSLDLIYGTPGESLAQWQASLEAALAAQPDHISTYALVVEPGTAMWKALERRQMPAVDEDEQAEKYELADRVLSAAGYAWYEISNWARMEPGEEGGTTGLKHASKHNLAYWADADWWGIGPGAHSHLGAARWWNRKHPLAWLRSLQAGKSPAQAGEFLTRWERELEFVMLGIRTADGLQVAQLPAEGKDKVESLVEEGLLELNAQGRVRLTLRGRLLADYVTRELTA